VQTVIVEMVHTERRETRKMNVAETDIAKEEAARVIHEIVNSAIDREFGSVRALSPDDIDPDSKRLRLAIVSSELCLAIVEELNEKAKILVIAAEEINTTYDIAMRSAKNHPAMRAVEALSGSSLEKKIKLIASGLKELAEHDKQQANKLQEAIVCFFGKQ